jgi:hypothetical protein
MLEPWGPMEMPSWKTFIGVSPDDGHKIIKVKISNRYWRWKFVWMDRKEVWIEHPDMMGFVFVGHLVKNELIGESSELYNITQLMLEKFKEKKLSYVLI